MKPRKLDTKPREHGRLCARTRATQIEIRLGPPAARAEVGSPSRPAPEAPSHPVPGPISSLGLGAPSDPVGGASGLKKEHPCLEAEVAA
jgi:hypothetical protein